MQGFLLTVSKSEDDRLFEVHGPLRVGMEPYTERRSSVELLRPLFQELQTDGVVHPDGGSVESSSPPQIAERCRDLHGSASLTVTFWHQL